MVDSHMASIKNLLMNDKVREIGREYTESKESQPENSFNVFEIISDKYRRELFHSHIIKTFLDPTEKHNEGSLFLFTFIDFLNENFKDKVYIYKQNYCDAQVERERRNIDICIKSDDSKHCIIIENKINNAGDTSRQLPKYYDEMTRAEYIVDAIVYLPLAIDKKPYQGDWSDADKSHVLPLLCIVPAYQKRGVNLVTGWIEPCARKAKSLDCVSILRQYGELIKKLNDNLMDNFILSKFYQSLIEDKKSFETALSIRNMLSELPNHMASRLVERFGKEKVHANKEDVGYEVWQCKPNFCGIIFQLDKQYKIDIWTSENGYGIYVFAQDGRERYVDWAKDFPSLESFEYTSGEYKNVNFTFFDEDKVVECVNKIIKDIREYLGKPVI